MPTIVRYNPECYLIQPTTGLLHIVSKDDPLRKRLDLRVPTQAEVDAHYNRIEAILSGKPIPVPAVQTPEVSKPEVTSFVESEEVQEAIKAAKKRGARPKVKLQDIDSELDDVV